MLMLWTTNRFTIARELTASIAHELNQS